VLTRSGWVAAHDEVFDRPARPWWWWLAFGVGTGWLLVHAWAIHRVVAGWPL
jgi:hypothetical protein